MRKWRIEDSEELYNITGWGTSYFGINDKGHVVVTPRKDGVAVDLKELVDELQLRDVAAPVLVRFPDILDNRIEKVSCCFRQAADEYGYKGENFIIYPIKVNQMRPVVEEMINHGKKFNLGLEAGSKPELHAVIGVNTDPGSLVVCNGYKDESFIELALLAQKMGKKDIADEFYKRSQNYKNVYNPATSFMQPRDDKGVFIKDFKADDYTPHICESNGWQYFWSVQHDVDGLVNLVGGKNRFAEKLDSMFTYHPSEDDELPLFSTGMIGQYAHGNEPSHHVIYLFNSIGFNDRTQYYVAKVMNELYKNEPAGLCGNEDCGQMSAWYILNSMGFYQVCPGKPIYSIGRPAFDKAVINLPEEKTFSIVVKNNEKKNKYIESVTLNGQPLNTPFFHHQDIANGGTMEIKMTAQPTKWGVR